MMSSFYTHFMRTTLHIDDDLYEAARSMAALQRTSVGKVISALVRRALSPSRPALHGSGFPVFRVPDGTPPLTPDMVREALEDV
jgi:hypothetical protein